MQTTGAFLTRNKRLSLGIMNPVEAIGAVMRYVQVRIPKMRVETILLSPAQKRCL